MHLLENMVQYWYNTLNPLVTRGSIYERCHFVAYKVLRFLEVHPTVSQLSVLFPTKSYE